MPITLRTIAQSTLQGPTGPAGAAGTAGVTGPTGPSVTGPTGPGGVVPKVSSVSITDNSYTVLDDTAVDTAGGYIKVTGSGFTAGCSVLIGTTPATSTTFISESEVRAQVPAQSAGTYIVYVVNSDGGTATRVNGITYSASPTWTTASALPNATSNIAYTQALVATSATSYALQAGSSLPAGMTLTSGGSLSGTTVVANSTAYSFTVVASDAENQDSPRTFNLNVLAANQNTLVKLYGSSTNTFTDSSLWNHSVTRNGTGVTGTTSYVKIGTDAIRLTNEGFTSNVKVDISARNVYLKSSDWTLGYWWYPLSSSGDDYPVALSKSGTNVVLFGPVPRPSSSLMGTYTGQGSSFSNVNITLSSPSQANWYYYTFSHVAGSSEVTARMYNSAGSLLGSSTYSPGLDNVTVDPKIELIQLNFYAAPSNSALDTVFFTSSSTPPSVILDQNSANAL